MNKTTKRILKAVESDPGVTAHDVARTLDMSARSVAMTLSHLYKDGVLERLIERERFCYYPIKKKPTVREVVSKETIERHEEYRKTKTVGNRAYTCTHMDMLKILASQGDMKAYQEIKRREAGA